MNDSTSKTTIAQFGRRNVIMSGVAFPLLRWCRERCLALEQR